MSLVLGLGLDHFSHRYREGISLKSLSLASNFFNSLVLASNVNCVLDSTSAIYDVYQSAGKNGSYWPNRLQNVILVFEPTLLIVIRIWCFYEWFISSFIKGKAMINSEYERMLSTKARWKSSLISFRISCKS